MKTLEINGQDYGFAFNMNVIENLLKETGVDLFLLDDGSSQDLMKKLGAKGMLDLACLSVAEWCRLNDKSTVPTREDVGGCFNFGKHLPLLFQSLSDFMGVDVRAQGNVTGAQKAPAKKAAQKKN